MNARSLFCWLIAWTFVSTSFAEDGRSAGEIARTTVLPKIEIKQGELQEAVDFMTAKTGLNVVVAIPIGAMPKVTLRAEKQSALEILSALASQAGCEVHEEKAAIILRKKGDGPIPPIRGDAETVKMWEKVTSRIVLPRADFREATAREAMEFIIQKSKQLDPENAFNVDLQLTTETDAKIGKVGQPVGAVGGIPGLPVDASAVAAVPEAKGDGMPRITMTLHQVSLLDVSRYVAAICDLEIVADKYRLKIRPMVRKSPK